MLTTSLQIRVGSEFPKLAGTDIDGELPFLTKPAKQTSCLRPNPCLQRALETERELDCEVRSLLNENEMVVQRASYRVRVIGGQEKC